MTLELDSFLKKLITLPGLSGYEGPVSAVIAEAWRPLVDQLTTSRLGSLQGLRRGQTPEPRPRLLLAAHMDAIGLMVSGIRDGLLRITEIGGIDARILPGQAVTVFGRRPLPGQIVQPPDHLLPPECKDRPVEMRYLFVDTGLLPEEVETLVRPGDLVAFAQSPLELGSDYLAGHSLDNRASVAALTLCLQELQSTRHAWDVWAVATAQEEETIGGAITSPFEIRPNLAVAIDVTFAKGPGASDYRTFPLGKGVTLGWGPNIHPALHQRFKSIADELDLPYQVEVMPTHSGTDAYSMQVVAEGIPTMVIGIPLRYMHTPVEMVSLKDVHRAGHLLAAFVARLEPDFVDQIRWEEQP
jgi:putative aminopeptidase FrvX